ncbi:MAG: hypothetical protein SFU25_04540, partial [Candidatus Caenarcaniphilales bacterium]|nr:hypothetical protein [Candidatus Caenarcaniphilales bacterium]
ALFKRELTQLEKVLSKRLPNLIDQGGVFEDTQPYSSGLEAFSQDIIKAEFVKPSISAILPAKAADIGVRICLSKGGTQTGNTCKVCRKINCAEGQEPTSEEQGICYGNNDGRSVCQCDCGACTGASLHKYNSACQSL